MKFPYEEFKFDEVRTYPLKSRHSKSHLDDFARPFQRGTGISGFVDGLPKLLAGKDFRKVVDALVCDQAENAGIVCMADETGRLLNQAINDGVNAGLGIGQAVGKFLDSIAPPHADASIFAAAHRLKVPVTVHVAIGTDVIHMHPQVEGAALGKGSLCDFRYFVSSVARLGRGVYLNCGSAVLLPEVFLKAVALARNRGMDLRELTTVNLDFIRHYRPQTNVVERPTMGSNRGVSLVGHHELLIPLLAAALIERVEKP